jgi:lipopolysaccharide export system permease protein
MKRLTAYLSRLFVTDALILFGVVCVLLWLVNCLRQFDVVAVKGQGVWTLAAQALLTMPPLINTFFYVCVGIGLVRALQSLQANRELHIIHTSHGLRSLWSAAAIVASAGVATILLISNFAEPAANRRLNLLSASIAADLVSATLKPQRFTQVTPGVILLIGGRSGDGEIREFFADDRRDPETRRTYLADSARVSTDGENYIIQLRDGALQYTEANGRFSEISFARYDINVDLLTQEGYASDPMYETNSVSLVLDAMASGNWRPELTQLLFNRMVEGLRVIGICMVVLAIAGFPSGNRRRFAIPMEAVVLLLAFAERGLSAYSPLGSSTGALLLMIVAAITLAQRTWPRRPKAMSLP